MQEFINLFFVPFIAVSIIYKRKKIEPKFDASFLIRYALSVLGVFIGTYAIMSITTLALGIGGDSTSNLYLFVSIIAAFIIPYVYEICGKYIKVSFEVKADSK